MGLPRTETPFTQKFLLAHFLVNSLIAPVESILKLLEYTYSSAGVPIRFAYIFWSMFLLIYWLLNRYEKRHHLQKQRTVRIKNYHGTLYLFGSLAALLYHGSISWGWSFYKQIAPDGPDYFKSGAFFLGLAGFLLMIVGLICVALARVDLNGYWGIHIYEYPRSEYHLIETGIYAKSRHPIYFGQIAMTIGTLMLSNDWWVAVFPVGTIALSLWRAIREERYLSTLFPAQFPSYRDQVSFIIPLIK